MYLDHEEVRLDRLALLDDPSHQVLDLGADPESGSGEGPAYRWKNFQIPRFLFCFGTTPVDSPT